MEDIMTLEEAAKYCGLTSATLGTAARKGKLEAALKGNLWITTREAVDRWRANTRKAGRPRKSKGENNGGD